MSIQVSNVRIVAGCSAQVEAASPCVAWSEPTGFTPTTLTLTGTLATREVALVFGASGNNITGSANGALTLTGSTTGTAATGTLTLVANATATTPAKTVTIGDRVYSLVSILTAANQVLIGATAEDTCDNLVAAINASGGSGYAPGTVAHSRGTAADGTGTTVVFTTTVKHSSENALATSTTIVGASWGANYLTGGVTPCVAEGAGASDITGGDLPAVASMQVIGLKVVAGSVNLSLGTKVVTLPVPAGGVFLYAVPAAADPGTITVAATAADTIATLAVFYK